MKKLLSIVALFALIFTACETANEETKKSGIKLTTDSEVTVSSGSAMGFIKYELTAPVEGATVVKERTKKLRIGSSEHYIFLLKG